MLTIVGSSPKGSSQEPFWDIDMSTAQPLAKPLGLWVEAGLVGLSVESGHADHSSRSAIETPKPKAHPS